jgi:hypothetical protein
VLTGYRGERGDRPAVFVTGLRIRSGEELSRRGERDPDQPVDVPARCQESVALPELAIPIGREKHQPLVLALRQSIARRTDNDAFRSASLREHLFGLRSGPDSQCARDRRSWAGHNAPPKPTGMPQLRRALGTGGEESAR